ncbi:MAG: PEP/pyruvate-binding domain-containing protein [Desulforhabdus sp.]|jgi:pyruvate,water dikinase|nr:PEP/pyruvate-binding domain-containing protein [Desulforhabdus sp.]
MAKEMDYLIHFQDDAALDTDTVGQKFAALAMAFRAGLPVPTAIAVSAEVHRFYRANGKWPDGALQSIRQAATDLELGRGISVRSSATLEDLPDRSFAGQYKTFLNVREEAELQEKIEQCWASVVPGSSSYAQPGEQQQLSGTSISMAVVLQKMVQARTAGVAFSRNPMFPARREVVVECVEGLGDRLVSGHVTPHRAYVEEGRDILVELPAGAVSKPAGRIPLQQAQWVEIASLARRAEGLASGEPRDIEWAYDRDGRLWLLQSRPITTFAETDTAAPEGVWTRMIADDLWADRLTPFLADAMLQSSSRFDLSRYRSKLGIAIEEPTLAVIKGFLYVNCTALRSALELIPRTLRTVDLRRLFPPAYEKDVTSPSLGRIASFVLRYIALALTDPAVNPFFSHRITLAELKKLRERLQEIRAAQADDPRQMLLKVHTTLDLMASLQETNQWPYSYATIFTWLLRWLTVDVAGMAYQDFLRLLGEGADNITIEIEAEVRRIADMIYRNRELREAFGSFAAETLAGVLPAAIEQELTAFIGKYGARSQHRTLLVKRWAEAPEQVLGMLAQLAKAPPNGVKHIRPEPLRISCQSPSPIARLLLPVQRMARKYLDLREELRFFLDQILYEIRRSLLELGAATGFGDDIMFLTAPELAKLVSGKSSPTTAHVLAKKRRSSFDRPHEPHTYYADGRPVKEFALKKGLLEGIGTSSGKASGCARIVENPGSSNLNRGDILIAKHTDPGWTPILSIVGGVVTEEGGLLNHCSIVARELGIPAVVGLREATRRIPEGAFITIDGDLGTVQIARSGRAGCKDA